jgi:small subunit ribosomal protein S21
VSEYFKGLEIKPRPNEEPDRYIKRFLKKVRNDGILQEVFLRRAYEKPSIKRRRKSARARFLKKIEDQAI